MVGGREKENWRVLMARCMSSKHISSLSTFERIGFKVHSLNQQLTLVSMAHKTFAMNSLSDAARDS